MWRAIKLNAKSKTSAHNGTVLNSAIFCPSDKVRSGAGGCLTELSDKTSNLFLQQPSEIEKEMSDTRG